MRVDDEVIRRELYTRPGELYNRALLMQTIRKPVRANIVAAARSGLFFIPLIFILPYFFGLLGVEMCQMWADCCSFAVAVLIAWSAFRDMRREQMELGKSH